MTTSVHNQFYTNFLDRSGHGRKWSYTFTNDQEYLIKITRLSKNSYIFWRIVQRRLGEYLISNIVLHRSIRVGLAGYYQFISQSNNMIDNLEDSTKLFWRYINSRKENSQTIQALQLNGNKITNQKEMASKVKALYSPRETSTRR